MSLNKPKKEETPQPTRIKTKKQMAEELALKYKDLPYDQAITKIRAEIPTSKTTAHNAIKTVQAMVEKEKAVKPSLEVEDQEKKTPEFLQEPVPIEEKEEIKPSITTELKPEEAAEQLELIRDMLRGVHVLLVSKEGILGEKYGRSKDQCVQVSDQLYRYLRRRISVEEFERYDTILLAISYLSLVGGVAADIIKERQKPKKEEKKS